MLQTVYRLLLRLLPSEYDRVDRAEMRATFERRVEAARSAHGGSAAVRKALAELVDLTRVVARSRGPAGFLDGLGQDARLGLRSFARSPVVSGLAVLCLALGIGATTAIFSSIDVWLIRPLPLPNAERLVSVTMANRAEGRFNPVMSVPDFVDWRRESETVDLAVYRPGGANLTAEGHDARISTLQVSVNFPRVVGFSPQAGRFFSEDEERAGGPGVAVVSDGLWRELGGDDSVLGRSIRLDGVPYTVIGVLPPGAAMPGQSADAWIPLRVSGDEARSGHSLFGVALMEEGVSMGAAASELDAVAGRVAEQDPDRTFPNAAVRPLREAIYGPEFEQGGRVVAGAVFIVLLIACANIANLLLVRGLSRTREMAVRGALGAGRGRIVRLLLTESAILAVVGGTLGIGVGYVGVELLVSGVLAPSGVPGWEEIALNQRALTFAVVLTLASVLVFGLAPALRTADVDVRERLSEGDRGSTGRGQRLASALVVAEIAGALAMLVICGLLLRDVAELQMVDLGMRAEDAVVFRLSTPSATAEDAEAVVRLHERVAERVASMPAVTGAAVSTGRPLGGWSTRLYFVPGLESVAGDRRQSAESRRVSSSYAEVMEMPVLAGRWFEDGTDRAGSPPVAVVSRALADRWWERPFDALGHTVRMGDDERTIVGVVDAGRLRGPGQDPPPVIFEPFAQAPSRFAFHVVAHERDASVLATELRDAVRSVDPELAIFGVSTLEDAREDTFGETVAAFRVFGALALLAFALTVVGVYGVMAHTVGRRRREMGLRLALGADPGGVTRLVLRRSAKLGGIGVLFGVALGFGAGQGLAFLLVGVSPYDPLVMGAAAASVLGSVLLASWLPARRAARVDPALTLRAE